MCMQDWELFRVWDSAEVEHTEEDETEHHFRHHAELTSEQTGAVMYLGQNGKNMLHIE